MNFYGIPNRIESAVLLAEADEAELMSEYACLYLSSIYDLCGTDYEDIVPLCESARYGPSADMWERFTALSCCRSLKGTLSARD